LYQGWYVHDEAEWPRPSADVAVFSTKEPRKPLQCEPLLSERLVAIGPSEAGLGLRKPIGMRELCRQPTAKLAT
jgi:hypothetical protein